MGVQYDTRTKIEVLEDFRQEEGIDAKPFVVPKELLNDLKTRDGFNTEYGKIFPLGGISNTTTVFCNENGFWPIYESDEHGFNNPKGLYTKNQVDIVLIGDSFSHGACVHSHQIISAVLREFGYEAVNVGMGGNGPLIELATLKEYAEPLKPKVVGCTLIMISLV